MAANTLPQGLGGGYGYRLIDSRAPQRLDESKPSLSTLGTELILIIAEMVYRDSPGSVKNLALVSSRFYHATRNCLFGEIRLDISAHEKELLKKRLANIERGGLLPVIRRVSLRGAVDDKENMAAVRRFLSKASGLRDLEWLHPEGTNSWPLCVPDEVLLAVHNKTAVRLHTYIRPPSQVPLQPIPTYETLLLAGSENLHSLRICFNIQDLESYIKTIHIIKCILLSSPNIRKLAIDFGIRRSGCVIRRPPRRYNGFGFVDGQRPPALEELELGRYPWGYKGGASGYQGNGDEVDYWVDTFDWSRLRCLKTQYVEFACKLAPKLISLENASIAEDATQCDLHEFYEAVPNSLSTIIAPNLGALGVDGITRFGPTLKILHIHQRPSPSWADTAPDEPSLLEIRRKCPLIEELVVDVARQHEWPYGILDILAGFKKLQRLTVWFGLNLANGHLAQPLVTYFAAEKLFMYINSKRPSTISPLKELWVRCGDPKPLMGFGYRIPPDPRLGGNIPNYFCRLSERDDEAAKGMFDISCPGLNVDENAQLRRIRRGDEVPPEEPSDSLTVAIYGPARSR